MVPSMDVDVKLDEPRTEINSHLNGRLLDVSGEVIQNGAAFKSESSYRTLSKSNHTAVAQRLVVDTPSMMITTMDCRKLIALVGAFYWLLLIGLVLPAACVSTLFIFIYPTMLFSMSLFNRLEHELCRMVNDIWVAAGQYAGLTVTEYGDNITDYADKRCLCLVNHLGLVDHFCLMTAFHDKKSLSGKYLWVIFNIWRFTTLGVMWTTHGNFFINGGAANRERKLTDFRHHLSKNFIKHNHGWVVMYPEGSRLFLIRKSEMDFCRKNGLQPFKHCAHPRTGAAHSALRVCTSSEVLSLGDATDIQGMPEGIEYVVDCTLGYPRGEVVSLGEAMINEWLNNEANIAIHYRVHKIRPEWVADEKAFRSWLYEQYKAKDELLDDFYRRGKFPGTVRPVWFPQSRYFMVQAFWLVLFYFHFNVWFRPLVVFLFKSLCSLVL